MKGLNTSRIAALAATAIIFGATAVSAATLYYGNNKLVEENGAPVAKVVVGANAAVSDGIAAANIVAAIAQNTYARSDLKARVSGQATCAVGGGSGTAAGTCEISDKKVTIDITIPGQLANAHEFRTLISDSVDRQLGNRMNSLPEDNYTSSMTASDTGSVPPSPLRAVYGASDSHGTNLYRIGQNEFSPFNSEMSSPLRDQQATSEFTYTETQAVWVGTGAPSYDGGTGVYFDSNALYRQVVARPQTFAYSAFFGGNDFGIPVCTQTSSSGLWASCKSDTDQTERHRLGIHFLGQTWVISKMTAPSNATSAGQLANSNDVVNGGSIQLAKEADYRIISIGESIDAGTFKVRLADISVAVGANNTHPAIMDVMDSNDQVVGQIQVTPGSTYTFTQTSTGSAIKVHVYQTAGGLTLSAKWAEIAIYTDEITLEDTKRYNYATTSDPNWGNVYASLLWKNRDGSASDNQADSLRQIILYVDDVSNYMGTDARMKAGDSLVFPKKDSIYRLTYNGLDLAPADYASLRISSASGQSFTVAMASDCNAKNGTWQGSMIKVSSDTANAFGGSSSSVFGVDDRVQEFYYDPIGNSTTAGLVLNMTQNQSALRWSAVAFWKPSGCTYYKYGFVTKTGPDAPAASTSVSNDANLGKVAMAINASSVKFDVTGDDSSAPGLIAFGFGSNATLVYNMTVGASYSSNIQPTSAPYIVGEIVLQEDAGKMNTTSHHIDQIRIPVYNLTTNNWRFKNADSSTTVSYYSSINLASPNNLLNAASGYELPVYSERGSKVTDVSITGGLTMSAARKIGQPKFTFAAANTQSGSENTESWIAKEGDTRTLSNGVKLTVKSITQTVGSCTAGAVGGAPACTVNQDNVKAVVEPAVTSVLTPYSGDLNMVIWDSQAGSVSGTIITVGGPIVNTVTADAIKNADSAIDFDKDNVVVKGVGKVIIVAGKSAENTMQAADKFISELPKPSS